MRNSIILFVALVALSFTALAKEELPVIPRPVSMERLSGDFKLPDRLFITINTNNTEVKRIAEAFGKQINNVTGNLYSVGSHTTKIASGIRLNINTSFDSTLHNEGYRLNITKQGINITANKPAGIFYGLQTLVQVFPPEIENKKRAEKRSWTLPCINVVDYPTYEWRGMMLDVVRHYYDKQQVEALIDDMVKYKFNVLHLHLTDDQGWRLQINSFPKLTEVGAWRAERTGRWGEFTKPTAEEPKTYGGFFTHADIKELVKYAQDRFVTILPEIDVPGHSLAAVAAYPELSSTPGEYYVNAGDKFMFRRGTGFYGVIDNTLSPANEKVYTVLDSVFTEVASLFPCEYIHIGGDECYKGFWEKSEACKELMQREGLKNSEELQSYFIKRVEKIIQSKGKKMMGWDEILEGGLAPDATVMSWRGMAGGIEAAKMNHKVIMTPNSFAYLDLYQGDPVAEPLTYSMLRLKTAYAFNPLPAGVDPKYILGGQCNLWTERVPNIRHAQYMIWPRAFAIAESLWSPAGRKNWDSFVQRVEHQFKRLDVENVKYSRSMYDPIFTVANSANGRLVVTLDTEVEGLDTFYSFDETDPDRFFPHYNGPVEIPKEAANLRVVTYRNGKQVGKIITMPIAELKKRVTN